MAETSAGKGKGKHVKGVLDLIGLEGEPPELRLEAVAPTGERTEIDIDAKGQFQLPESHLGKGFRLELAASEGPVVRRFAYDSLVQDLRQEPALRLPARDIIGWLACVSGRVTVCSYILDPVLSPLTGKLELTAYLRTVAEQIDVSEVVMRLPHHWPGRHCRPVCQGRVQVWVRICCCPFVVDPPLVVKRLCEIIDCPEIVVRPPWPPPGPWGPRPGPGPDPAPGLERATVRALKRAEIDEDAPSAADVLVASAHLSSLATISPAEQVEYIRNNHDLQHWFCQCWSYKVAEVPLQADGRFDACFRAPRVGRGCHARVVYRVSQASETGWNEIYDGFTGNQSFELNDEAVLYARRNALACDDPHDYGPVPFVLLEQIGNTWADTLVHSTEQTGETTWGPLAAKDGLANAKPVGAPITTGPYDQPWATTLNLRFQFHPGLQALGARFYRVRVVPVDNGKGGAFSSPVPTEFTVMNGVQWRKYNPVPGGGVGTHWESLNDATPGFYRIPFPDLLWPWLGGQWHAYVVTHEQLSGVPRMPDGRYLFVVDIFDAGHNRLVPNGTTDALAADDTTKAFEHRRLDGPIDVPFSNTSVVPHNALASLFRVDNAPCYGDIEQIVNTGTPSAVNCQFLTGPATNTLQLEYSAYQANGFQWYHEISYKQGLSGPVTSLPASSADVYSGLSPSRTFGELLGGETKCAFAAYLGVLCRHTNGIGRISGYDRSDNAAFALEQT